MRALRSSSGIYVKNGNWTPPSPKDLHVEPENFSKRRKLGRDWTPAAWPSADIIRLSEVKLGNTSSHDIKIPSSDNRCRFHHSGPETPG